MANPEHLEILLQGVAAWNKWRIENSGIKPDLRGVDLGGADLRNANLNGADLRDANLYKANLNGTDLSRAMLVSTNLDGANLSDLHVSDAHFGLAILNGANLVNAHLRDVSLELADLRGADLSHATLEAVNLCGANLEGTNLSDADLSDVNLTYAILVKTSLKNAILKNCSVYAVSAWGVILEGAIQTNLVITTFDEPTVTVDDLEVAQFIYLLLNNAKVRNVIDTITSKAVLILGRFTEERKHVLDTLRDDLRKRNYLPILFDGDGPESRDFTETVRTIASMARFVIADISEPRCVQQELQAIVPDFLSMAVQPIIVKSETPYSMFRDIQRRQNVAPLYTYDNEEHLLQTLVEKVIVPAEELVKQLRPSIDSS